MIGLGQSAGMDLSSSSGTPTAKEHLCFAEMQSLDADRGLDTVAQAEVRIPWRTGSTATPTPPRLLQRRGVFSLRIWPSGRRSSTWRSRSLGQVSLLRAVIVS